MFDEWRLHDFAPGDGIHAGARSEAYADDDWLPIQVPGDVHKTLIEAGRIPDPYYDQNEAACAWMEEREWWYRVRFVAPAEPLADDERLMLVFHGLDTYATVYLNGQELGKHRNMFRPAQFDVGSTLRLGLTNVLVVCFDRPLDHAPKEQYSAWGRNPERAPMRKAQFGYGWDWGPRLPTIGIWRPVELRREKRAALVGTHAATVELAPDHSWALVAVRVEAERFAETAALRARISLAPAPGPDGVRPNVAPIVAERPLGGDGVALDGSDEAGARRLLDGTEFFGVAEPRLWWTHDLGEPARYELTVTLLDGDTELDRRAELVGIRTLVLDQSPDTDEPGTRFFRFVLNGVPVFAKGANWIPCDSFVGAIPEERYTRLLEAARDANMTMLRIWGGGIYEHDRFYDECDRLGILVWQDFMFACATYPEEDPDFNAEVEAEARYQVRRLRSHPSLALWCGNNENQWIHEMRNWDRPEVPPYGALFYHEILPRVCAELDGRTPYWPGSPYGGDDYNSMDDGDRHNWDVWHGQYPRHFGEEPRREFTPESVTYLRYAEDRCRFQSEFGMHAAPVLETLKRAIPEAERYHHSPALDWHNKDTPKDKGDMLMQSTTGVPSDLAEYVDFSQLAQAEGLKFGIEHFRRRTPHCSGALVWQLNDCWPVLSWSVLDYYSFGKAGYFYLRRVFSPVLASFKSGDDGGVELWVTNDTDRAVEETATVKMGQFDGVPLWGEPVPIRVPAHTSQRVGRWDAERLEAGPERYLVVRSSADRFPTNRHFFAPIKDLKRTAAAPEMTVTAHGDGELQVTLQAPPNSYLLLVHLLVPDEATRFSDNYLDLEPGEIRTVIVTNDQHPLQPEMVTLGWR
ncbi:MAG: glycoside hydrolase family 2 protein [Chloroflexota bacterium]